MIDGQLGTYDGWEHCLGLAGANAPAKALTTNGGSVACGMSSLRQRRKLVIRPPHIDAYVNKKRSLYCWSSGWHMTEKTCIPSELNIPLRSLLSVYVESVVSVDNNDDDGRPWSWWACKHEGGFWSRLGNLLLLVASRIHVAPSLSPRSNAPLSSPAVGPAPLPNILFVSPSCKPWGFKPIK